LYVNSKETQVLGGKNTW